jgi:ABC-type polysaccharide/polyol phosphate export permease
MVNIFQELMYHGRITALDFWLRTAATSIVILIVGFLVFRRYSPRFGEEL